MSLELLDFSNYELGIELIAKCNSQTCAKKRIVECKNYKNRTVTYHGTVKNVSRDRLNCPDCGSALLWAPSHTRSGLKLWHSRNKLK